MRKGRYKQSCPLDGSPSTGRSTPPYLGCFSNTAIQASFYSASMLVFSTSFLLSCVQVALTTRFNGIGYTFVLAGFLKIVTLGGLVMSAPVDAARTAFGKASPYLMVPVGLGLCWVAKQVTARSTRTHDTSNAASCLIPPAILPTMALQNIGHR